jgi:hypothetical protein
MEKYNRRFDYFMDDNCILQIIKEKKSNRPE